MSEQDIRNEIREFIYLHNEYLRRLGKTIPSVAIAGMIGATPVIVNCVRRY